MPVKRSALSNARRLQKAGASKRPALLRGRRPQKASTYKYGDFVFEAERPHRRLTLGVRGAIISKLNRGVTSAG